jgi:hypothetical protein
VQSIYGGSKAALETATEVWAKEVEGTGLTINIVNPGAGANTPGMAEEMRAMSREGRAPRLVEPDAMAPPLLYCVVSREADTVNGRRFRRQPVGHLIAARRGGAPRRPARRLRTARAAGLTKSALTRGTISETKAAEMEVRVAWIVWCVQRSWEDLIRFGK